MEREDEIRGHISKELALGKCSQEIIESLQEEFSLKEEDAVKHLREFYDKWQDLITRSRVQTQDQLNWHVWMRHQALQLAMKDKQTGTVLSILDSLAKLQRISEMTDEREIPISIILRPKEEINEGSEQQKERDGQSVKPD